MATALDIITRALRSINVLSDGETPTASMAQDALDSLNDVLESWANENLMVYVPVSETFPLTVGQGDYTIGPGANFDTVRPQQVTFAYARNGSIDYPIELWTNDQYASIGYKSIQNTFPSVLYYEPTYPVGVIHLWAVPSTPGMTLYLEMIKPFTRFSSLTSVVSLPPGYERALRFSLGAELMPEYGVSNALVLELATSSKADIKRRNFQPVIMSIDPMIPRGEEVFNIYQRF
jgi:hypothetical protein